MGNGSKINASEIVTKNPAGEVTALDLLGVECGSNANGEWVRFNFGLQMCWIVKPAWPGAAPNNPLGGMYRSESALTWIYPKPFYENPILGGDTTGVGYVDHTRSAEADKTSKTTFRVFRPTLINVDPTVWLFAFGWWKTPGT